jgi:hypothetical protein
MRNLRLLDAYRLTSDDVVAYYGSIGDHENGAFVVRSPVDGQNMMIIASSSEGWDHVSCSRKNRCPNWEEMEHVKRLFFRDGETAMQLHVPPSEHISVHPFCLHLWRPLDQEIPKPRPEFVATVRGSAE